MLPTRRQPSKMVKIRRYSPRREVYEGPDPATESDDSDSGEFKDREETDDEYGNSKGEQFECETDSERDFSPQDRAAVAKESRKKHVNEPLNVEDDYTNLSYVEKLEWDNLRLTQQLRMLSSEGKTSQECEIPELGDIEIVESKSERESGQETGAGDLDDNSTQRGEAPTADNGPSLEILRYKKKQKEYGGYKLVRDSDATTRKNEAKDLTGKHVLKVKREFDLGKIFWRTCIEIFSPNLQHFLDQVPGFMCTMNPVDDVYFLTEPLMDLFLNRKALTAATEKQDSKEKDLIQARSHVQLVLDFLRSDFPDLSRKLDDLESETPSKTITYPELFLLYKPGTIVYTLENGEYEAFVIDSLRGMNRRHKRNYQRFSHGRLDLTCWSLNYDGEAFGRVWTMHCLAPFDGVREISSLDLIPEQFLPDAAKVRDSLLTRGRKFWALQGQQCHEYTGELYSQHTKEEATRVMVDHLTYQRRHRWPISINQKRGPSDALNKNWKDDRFRRRGRRHYDDDSDWDMPRRRRSSSPPPEDMVDDDFDGRRRGRDDDWTGEPYKRYNLDYAPSPVVAKYETYDLLEAAAQPDELALLVSPQYVHGYCLREKTWKNLNINQLRPVCYRENAWSRLVLDPEYKSIVRAMVSSYVTKSPSIDDLVAGKGSGLVALLHGPPGSGKTLTAECVADSFHKPLYQVTCGDIGTDPEQLESRLEEIFDYSTTWGAILLLDEADIFLQDRDYTSLERNALVSIFLRTLDYFSGILFLTTNRVGAFDQAFQSRIHVTLGLPVLDQSRRIAVWNIFVDDLAEKNAYSAEERDRLRGLVREKWSRERLNGRQIRNAMRTALVVAEQKGGAVGDEEVGVVLRIGREFEGFMKTIGRAQKEGIEGFEEVVQP